MAIIKNAAKNICVQDFVWVYVFGSLVQIPNSAIGGLFGKFIFNFLRIHKVVLRLKQCIEMA